MLLVGRALLFIPGHVSVQLPQEHYILPALAVWGAPLGLTIPAVTFDQLLLGVRHPIDTMTDWVAWCAKVFSAAHRHLLPSQLLQTALLLRHV